MRVPVPTQLRRVSRVKGEMEDDMTRVIAIVLLTLTLAGCVYDGGGGYPRTLGPQGDTAGATGS